MSGDQQGNGRWFGPADVLTNIQLLRLADQASAALRRLGVTARDPVAVQLPMCLESVVITLACLTVGAQRLTLPIDDQRDFVRTRLNDSGARVVICADSCEADGQVHPTKAAMDRTLTACPAVRTVLVVRQLARPVPWHPGRDRWWHEELGPGSSPPRPYPGHMTDQHRPEPGRAVDRLVFDDPLSGRSGDDSDRGWGDSPAEDATEGNLVRLLDERPPHHI
ncbi:AMP-binding protein [Streptomyces sp. DSM 44915]|uniref:AMP-binding protein n=1 Tax=Streptomyces chisholmiae TaxID=3075540 RepID=A0ABU2JUQ8_9ACTN|nr:AMP-binding protein [Streptomyces sp. DSM 44915]MDT0268264.1 AMP-binding protein [Streptomyces sp. DSM 44915]